MPQISLAEDTNFTTSYLIDFILQAKRVFYVSNNSMKTRAEYKVKCDGMGLPAEEV